MERFICIHGHFYQPPRENAWLESIELQDSARPYHDWNERINVECYAPNSASRILDDKGRIEHIVSNYARMSFNFGPSLLSWMERNAPETYQAILESDRDSQKAFGGHGSAMAQAYNHMIMPLANHRDKYTQVLWGLADFRLRYGRNAEGMWLPETAVDVETLDVLAELGVRFTILATRQARRVRSIGAKTWKDVSGSRIDTTMPYLVKLPSGRTISIFFYHDSVAHAVAFEGLLDDGEKFYQRLLSIFSETETAQLAHIATDGETYGHHHRFGDMALAYAIHKTESETTARLTNYGEFLEKHPPVQEVEIFENTSWSCAHGVERWRSNCGCQTGGHPGWNQSWRGPLREALEWLRDAIAPKYEQKARELLKDPWLARDDYVNVVLDRSSNSIGRFFAKFATRTLSEQDRVTALKLLELQRHAMLMFTSDAWFFDEISGIETVQVMQYAGRASQLAQELFGDSTEARFLSILERAKSNVPEQGNGKKIYQKYVSPAAVDLKRVTAHYGASSLFKEYAPQDKVYSYTVNREDYRVSTSGMARFASGKVRITSDVTQESGVMSFAVLHFGDHNLRAGVRQYQGEDAYAEMTGEVGSAFSSGDLPETIRLLDKHFPPPSYSLKSLFKDEQRLIITHVLRSTLAEIEIEYRQVYERNYALMRFVVDLGHPLPPSFHHVADLVLNADLGRAFASEQPDPGRIEDMIAQAKLWGVHLDSATHCLTLSHSVQKAMNDFASQPSNSSYLKRLENVMGLVRSSRLEVNLWKVQNVYYRMLQDDYPQFRKKADAGNPLARDWVERFTSLGERFSVRVG